MKKLITSIFLIFGLYSNSFSQIDTCTIDYYSILRMDTLPEAYFSELSLSSFGKYTHSRYEFEGKMSFAVDFKNKFKVEYFEIITNVYPYHEYLNPCQMEEKYLKK